MSVKVFIDGREGTTGLRITERFENRSDTELLLIPEEKRKDADMRRKYINAADIVFLCLPDSAARESVSMVENSHVRVIDTSTAHRTDPAFAYGFPELSAKHRSAVASCARAAVPGCHAGGAISLIYPLQAAGLLPPSYPLTVTSLTGYSGGGKKMIAAYEDGSVSPLLSAPRQYGLGQTHKHLPEICSVCGLDMPPVFIPIVSDYYSGMEVTLPVFPRLLRGSPSLDSLGALFAQHYAGQHFITVHAVNTGDEQGFVSSGAMSGKDSMEIFIFGNDDRAVLLSRFDNLGKGASGAAVQCMNIMLGIDEATGLSL